MEAQRKCTTTPVIGGYGTRQEGPGPARAPQSGLPGREPASAAAAAARAAAAALGLGGELACHRRLPCRLSSHAPQRLRGCCVLGCATVCALHPARAMRRRRMHPFRAMLKRRRDRCSFLLCSSCAPRSTSPHDAVEGESCVHVHLRVSPRAYLGGRALLPTSSTLGTSSRRCTPVRRRSRWPP